MRRVMLAAALLAAGPVGAQQDGSTRDQAGNIISQPGRDVGLIKTRIPPVLQRAEAAPYAAPPDGCPAITSAMADLDDALGPDYGHATTRRGSRVGTLAKLGGSAAVDSLIPFRGVVREVSGGRRRSPPLRRDPRGLCTARLSARRGAGAALSGGVTQAATPAPPSARG